MPLVNWRKLLSKDIRDRVRVDYSYLHVPENRFELDQDVLRMALPGDYFIDVEWSEESETYTFTLYRHFCEYDIYHEETNDANKIVDLVVHWATNYSRQLVTAPDSRDTAFIKGCAMDCVS